MSPGVLALPSICLRCQLHAAILQTGTFRNASKHIAQRCKAFSTHRPRLQEAGGSKTWIRNGGGYKWKSLDLKDAKHGTKPKPLVILEEKRKRKTKDRTSANARPPDISVSEDKLDQEDADRLPSTKHIESVVRKGNVVPTQAEVNASMETMRLESTKQSTVMDMNKYQVLLQDLAKSYTVHQLGRYLERSVKSSSNKVYKLETSPWRPGRTPITQRPAKDVKKERTGTKLKISEQILRLVWEITIESEENEDGELEIQLEPWKLSFLFDITSNGTRNLEGLVTPPSLIQQSEIQAYRPDNVMRITGRGQTAEEIARQLKLALLKVDRLVWDLKPVLATLGTPGVAPLSIFRDEDISYVAQLTKSVIVPEADGLLAIYCMYRSGRLNARRLLLALLDKPHLSFDGIAFAADEAADATSSMPVGNAKVGVQRRYYGCELLRTVKPVEVAREASDENLHPAKESLNKAAVSLAKQLDSVKRPGATGTSAKSSDSYWSEQTPSKYSAWEANVCTLLHLEGRGSMPGELESSAQPQRIVQQAVPGLESLLSYFEEAGHHKESKPAPSTKKPPYIKAHLKPAAQDPKLSRVLPRLEMRFHFSEPETRTGARELTLTDMQAVIDEQRLSVNLPSYATDLQFIRQSNLVANIDTAKTDASIVRFMRHLQKSAHLEKGALTAPQELLVELPSWLVHQKDYTESVGSQDLPVTYLFERFEHIQELEFAFRQDKGQDQDMHANVKAMLEDLPEDLRLDYREVEGGAIYGNNTMLSLNFGRDRTADVADDRVELQSEQTDSISSSSPSLQLAGTALRIAYLLTRAHAGTLDREEKKN